MPKANYKPSLDQRCANRVWHVRDKEQERLTPEAKILAVMMDVRDELQQMNWTIASRLPRDKRSKRK